MPKDLSEFDRCKTYIRFADDGTMTAIDIYRDGLWIASVHGPHGDAPENWPTEAAAKKNAAVFIAALAFFDQTQSSI